MDIQGFSDILLYVEPGACLLAIGLILSRGLGKKFSFLLAFIAVRFLSDAVAVPLLSLARNKPNGPFLYTTYFYCYWASYAIEAILGFCIIYSIYNLAMAPLPGLQRLGRLMFRWAAWIPVAMALATALAPRSTSVWFVTRVISQMQQTQSVLTLCMLLFVCLTIRPMGLSFGSKIFGVSLGLGILATAQLVTSAWYPSSKSMYALSSLVTGIVSCMSILIWAGYFAFREPKRRMIILPTTSPFLRWNQISIALGDEPGYVALGEVTADMLAPAEVEIMRRASVKLTSAFPA